MIRCPHFLWKLFPRENGVWYVDGRSQNPVDAGRHSLGTRNKPEALRLLNMLDEACAIQFGLIERPAATPPVSENLSLLEGRRIFEQHIGRPRVAGGVKDSTKKRYRAILDKFVPWAIKAGISFFQQVDAAALNQYGAYLEDEQYAPKTQHAELSLIKQCVRHLIEVGALTGCEPIKLKLRKIEGQRAYCYRRVEADAIIGRCRELPKLDWLGDVVTALACSGMRIGELVNLSWSDIDLDKGLVMLADESGHKVGANAPRTLKSGQSRSFSLYPRFRAVIERLPKVDQYLFHGPRGGRLKADFVRRTLVRHVIQPLAEKFPSQGGQGFIDGRLHSFRHYFVSECAAQGVPERIVMNWVGHADSAMVRHYFHLHDEESQSRMNGLNLLGGADGCSGGSGSKS